MKPGVYQPAAGEGENRVFDLEGGYVLTGLRSTHAHLSNLSPDPLENIYNIRQLKLVLKDGKLVDTSPQEELPNFWQLFF